MNTELMKSVNTNDSNGWGFDVEALYVIPSDAYRDSVYVIEQIELASKTLIVGDPRILFDYSDYFYQPQETDVHYTMTDAFQQLNMFMSAALCVCASHGGLNPQFEGLTFNASPFENVEFAFSQADSHADHDHCDCGGHFSEHGKCEKCGKKKT